MCVTPGHYKNIQRGNRTEEASGRKEGSTLETKVGEAAFKGCRREGSYRRIDSVCSLKGGRFSEVYRVIYLFLNEKGDRHQIRLESSLLSSKH